MFYGVRLPHVWHFTHGHAWNRLIIAPFNINSLRNKFDSLVQMLYNNLNILLIFETKIDSSLPTAHFQIEGYTNYRLYNPEQCQRQKYTSLYHGRHVDTAEFWYVYWRFLYWDKYMKKEMAFGRLVQPKLKFNFKPS